MVHQLVHDRIIELATSRGIALDVLADRVGALSADEPFLYPSRLSTVSRYATALDVPIWELFIEPGTFPQ